MPAWLWRFWQNDCLATATASEDLGCGKSHIRFIAASGPVEDACLPHKKLNPALRAKQLEMKVHIDG